MVLQRSQTEDAQDVIRELDGPPAQSAADEKWFNEAVAIMVITPIALAILLALCESLVPAYDHWRSCVAINPAFPPSAMDFFLRGQTRGQAAASGNVPARPCFT